MLMKRIKIQYAKYIVKWMKSNKFANRFVTQSIGRAYDQGYKAGLKQFALANFGDDYKKNVRKAIDKAYNECNL